jgi:hypothetical protein
MTQANRRIALAARPVGWPKDTDFRLEEAPIPEPGDGEVLIRVIYLSVDPYMRGRMSEAKSYAAPVEVNQVMTGGGVGQVVESRHEKFSPGDYVEAMTGWQEFAVLSGKALRKVDRNAAPLSAALGVLGMPGLTAYFGVTGVCKANAGETVVVSGAAGAVGSVAGQIAKIIGCRAVGIAGTDEKVAWLTGELGFDAAFNYKTAENCRRKLAELCPAGIDCYFDNVGGSITDAALALINERARVAICGQISQYNLDKPEMGPRMLGQLIVKRARIEGFLVLDYAGRFREAREQLANWVSDGRIKYREQFTEGIESAPAAFLSMMHGGNTGKQLVRISKEQ